MMMMMMMMMTMMTMTMTMEVLVEVIVLKLKYQDGQNIIQVKLLEYIVMVHMILNLMMVNVNQVLKKVKFDHLIKGKNHLLLVGSNRQKNVLSQVQNRLLWETVLKLK